MKKFIKECRKEMLKRNLIVVALLAIVLVVLLWIQGPRMLNYIGGAKDFESISNELVVSNDHSVTDMDDLKNQLVKLDIDLIVGSYAEYGQKDESPDYVYYLYPMNYEDYYLTIIANRDYIENLDIMEEAFYNKVMDEENIELPDTIETKGGFQKLSEEALPLALEFFESEEDGITSISDLDKIMSPYAYVIDEMNTTSLVAIPVYMGMCVLLGVAIIVLLILCYTGPQLKAITADIDEFDEAERNHIDEDFAQASVVKKLRFGKLFYYVKTKWQYRIFAYQKQLWIFKKPAMNLHRPAFSLYAYNDKGVAFIITTSEDEKEIDTYIQNLYDHCEQAIFGEQAELWELAKRDPQALVAKIKEMKPERVHVQPIAKKQDQEEKQDVVMEEKKEPKKDRTVVKSNIEKESEGIQEQNEDKGESSK